MATKKGVKTNGDTTGKTKRTASGGYTPTRWANVRLDDNDTAYLAEATADLNQLAAMACQLVVSGYSLSIKPMDGGDSVMACITGLASDDSGVTVGVSGFGANVRDSLLVVLYKFEDKLGGELPNADSLGDVTRPRFR